MSANPVYGWQSQLGITTAATLGAPVAPTTGQRIQFDQSTLGIDEEFVDTNGIRGTTARSGELVLPGRKRVHGQIGTEPTMVELDQLLAWVPGGSPSGSPVKTYPLADVRLLRDVWIDDAVAGKVIAYQSLGVDRFTIRGSGDGEQRLQFLLDVVGMDAVVNPGAFPSLTLDTSSYPLLFNMASITVNSHTYEAKEFEGVFDFAIDKERFLNSRTLTAVKTTDRHVTCNLTLPWGDAYPDWFQGIGGVTVVVTFTYLPPGMTTPAILTLTYNHVEFPAKPRQIQRGQEVFQRFEGIAYKTGTSTLECVITLQQAAA